MHVGLDPFGASWEICCWRVWPVTILLPFVSVLAWGNLGMHRKDIFQLKRAEGGEPLKDIDYCKLLCACILTALSHEVMCEFVHLWCHGGAKKFSGFGAFQIFRLGILNLHYQFLFSIFTFRRRRADTDSMGYYCTIQEFLNLKNVWNLLRSHC